MSDSEKTYTNGKSPVIGNPGLAFHSAKCVRPGEFFTQRSTLDQHGGSGTERIIKYIEQCPF